MKILIYFINSILTLFFFFVPESQDFVSSLWIQWQAAKAATELPVWILEGSFKWNSKNEIIKNWTYVITSNCTLISFQKFLNNPMAVIVAFSFWNSWNTFSKYVLIFEKLSSKIDFYYFYRIVIKYLVNQNATSKIGLILLKWRSMKETK